MVPHWSGWFVPALLLAGVAAGPASAEPVGTGALIPTFGGGDGVVRISLTPPQAAGDRTASEPLALLDATTSGSAVGSFRTVSVAWSATTLAGYVTVRAFRSDGSVDPAWHAGRPSVLQAFSADTSAPGRMWIDSSRRIYVTDVDAGTSATLHVRRITASGSWDKGYSGPRLGLGDATESMGSVAVRPSGWAWLCGWNGLDASALVVREVTATGATVSTRTIAVPGTLGAVTAACGSVANGPDASLYVALRLDTGAGLRDAVARVTRSGGFDASFGDGGIAVLPDGFDASTPALTATALTSLFPVGGSLYVAGRSSSAGSSYPAVLRLTGAGALDASFGYAGLLRLAHPSTSVTSIDSDLAGGTYVSLMGTKRSASDPLRDPGVVRLSPLGRPVTSFGAGGYLGVPAGTGVAGTGPIRVVALRPDRLLLGETEARKAASGSSLAPRVEKRT